MIFKNISAISTIFIFLIFMNITAGAEYDYGAGSVYSALPDEAREYVDEKGITPENGGAMGLSVKEILSDIRDMLVENAEKPLKMFASLTAVIILTALLSGIKDSIGQTETNYAFALVSSLAGTVVIASFLGSALDGIGTALTAASDFMLAYVPVLAGIIAAGGQAVSASVFSSVMMVVIQVLTQTTSRLLIPLSSMMLGITAAGGLNADLKLEKIADGIKKFIVWSLGLIMTVFIGILTLQSTIASAADTVTLRAAKFAVSNSVPFIGGAVSDALSTVKSSMLLLRSGMGSFGVIAVSAALLPTLLYALCFRFFLFVSEVLSDMFSAEALGKVIRCGENVMSILIAIIVSMFLFATVSTTLMVMITRQ